MRWDADERSNVAAHEPERVAAMQRGVDAFLADMAPTGGNDLSPEQAEALRGLGCFE